MHSRAFPHCRQRRVWYWPWNDIYDDAPNTCKQCLPRVTKMPKESFLPLHLGKQEQHSQTVQVTFGRLDKLNAKNSIEPATEGSWKMSGVPWYRIYKRSSKSSPTINLPLSRNCLESSSPGTKQPRCAQHSPSAQHNAHKDTNLYALLYPHFIPSIGRGLVFNWNSLKEQRLERPSCRSGRASTSWICLSMDCKDQMQSHHIISCTHSVHIGRLIYGVDREREEGKNVGN